MKDLLNFNFSLKATKECKVRTKRLSDAKADRMTKLLEDEETEGEEVVREALSHSLKSEVSGRTRQFAYQGNYLEYEQ